MNQFVGSWLMIFKKTYVEFIEDKVFKLSAALAYYTIFSLPPMMIIIISATGLIYGKQAVEGKVYTHLSNYVGPKAAFEVEQAIKAIKFSPEHTWATTIGVITLIIGATGIFTEVQDSLNSIWGVKVVSRKGIWTVLLNRLISFIMVLGMGILLIASLVINALIASFSILLKKLIPGFSLYLMLGVNYGITFILITLLISIIYKLLPDVKINWKDVMIGSVATSILFMIGKFAIGFYLGHSRLGTAYGAAGSIVLLLVWVYYSSVILYFGAEFTQVYAHYKGGKILPKEYAESTKTFKYANEIRNKKDKSGKQQV